MWPEKIVMPNANVLIPDSQEMSSEPTDPNAVDITTKVLPENPDNTDPGVDPDPNAQVDPNAPAKKPIQPRINELVRLRHEAERRAEYWRGLAEGRTASAPANAPAPAAVVPPKPVAADFTTYDQYVDALTDWKADRKSEETLAKVEARIEERTSRSAAQNRVGEQTSNWNTRTEAAKAVIKDFDEVLDASEVIVQPHIQAVLLESEHGPKLAYKLALDPSLADKLNRMSPMAAAKEIGKLEMGIETPKPKPVSSAPTPPNPIPGGRQSLKALGDMPMEEYVAARKAQGAAWGR
jgi:hypothetical protein